MLCVYIDLSAAQRPNIDKVILWYLSFPLHSFKLSLDGKYVESNVK